MRRALRWAATITPLRGWALLGGIYVTAMVLNVFRVWQYGPDTRFYLAWAYRFGGMSEMEAGRRTYEFFNAFDWFAPFCWFACDTSDPTITYSWLFRGEEGGLFAQRFLYPLLSAPFVRLLGPPGLLVIPVVAYTAFLVMVVVLASRLYGPRWAVFAGIATLMPISMTAYGVYAYTEALAMALMAACLLMLPLGRRTPTTRRDLIVFGVLLVAFAFTRQFHHVLVLGLVFAFVSVWIRTRSWRNEWLPFAAVGVGASVVLGVVQTLMAPGYSLLKPFLEVSGAGSISGVPGILPKVLWRIVRGEVYTGGRDFGLVLLAVIGAAGLVTAFRTPLGQLTFGVVVGTFGMELITALNSQNRYWALSVPLLVLLATGFLKSVFASMSEGAGDASTAPTRNDVDAALVARGLGPLRRVGPASDEPQQSEIALRVTERVDPERSASR